MLNFNEPSLDFQITGFLFLYSHELQSQKSLVDFGSLFFLLSKWPFVTTQCLSLKEMYMSFLFLFSIVKYKGRGNY